MVGNSVLTWPGFRSFVLGRRGFPTSRFPVSRLLVSRFPCTRISGNPLGVLDFASGTSIFGAVTSGLLGDFCSGVLSGSIGISPNSPLESLAGDCFASPASSSTCSIDSSEIPFSILSRHVASTSSDIPAARFMVISALHRSVGKVALTVSRPSCA